MHFRVFIPGVNTANPAHLRGVGLEHLIPGATFLFGELNEVSGAIVSWNEDPGCDVTRYEWTPSYATDSHPEASYSVGMMPDAPPMPHELAWPKRLGGYWLTLGDGNEWCMPAAGMLPQSLKKRPDGTVYRQVTKEYRQHFNESLKWFADFIQRDFDKLAQTFDGDIFSYLGRALGMNYRLTPEVISELNLIDSTNLISCLRASIGDLGAAAEMLAQEETTTAAVVPQ